MTANCSETKPSTPPYAISRTKKFIFSIIIFLILAGILEITARKSMSESLVIGRHILLGRENAQLVRMQNTIGQAYLLYTSAPNYTNPRFGLQNNEDGYRGPAVPLDRQPGTLRILCLGGSLPCKCKWRTRESDTYYRICATTFADCLSLINNRCVA